MHIREKHEEQPLPPGKKPQKKFDKPIDYSRYRRAKEELDQEEDEGE